MHDSDYTASLTHQSWPVLSDIIVWVIAATKSDMLAEVTRLKAENKEGMEKQEDLMTSAKVLQRRITRQSKVMKCDWFCFPNISGPRREIQLGPEFKEISTFSEQKKIIFENIFTFSSL